MRGLRQLVRDKAGASAVEYALILALGAALAFVLVTLVGRLLRNTTTDVTGVGDDPGRVHDASAPSGSGPDAGFIRRSVVIP